MLEAFRLTRVLVDAAVATASDDPGRLALLRELEELTCFVAAAQAEVAVAFERSVVAGREAAGVPVARRSRGVAAEVALARRASAHQGSRLLTTARALVGEMPCTLAALRSGVLSEFRAQVLADETVCLSREDRAAVDAELCADPVRLEGIGTARLAATVRAAAYRRDPVAFLARSSRAREERHVSLRPAPDTMTWLGALLPVEHGVAVRACLGRVADAAVAAGDGRNRGQAMADALVQRVTGLDLGLPSTGSTGTDATAVPVHVDLVVSDETLLGGGAEPGWVGGYGPVPAQLARDLVVAAERQARAALRRVYAAPGAGGLVALDSRSRAFPAGLAHLIAVRDRTCRTPWCDAPVRHVDHVVPWADGGRTGLDNGQGLCVQCNHAKQAGGWSSRAGDDGVVEVTTPHGLTARSRAPDPPPPWSHPSEGVDPTRPIVLELYRPMPPLLWDLTA